MKTAFLILFLIATSVSAASEDVSIPPLKAIEQFGSISITDGSSFFKFAKDGSFQSGPLDESGRAFEGHWTASGTTFTVSAKLGWVNGASTGNEYRRIVFSIYYVKKRSVQPKPSFWLARSKVELFDSYFLIDELVKIPKPADSNKK